MTVYGNLEGNIFSNVTIYGFLAIYGTNMRQMWYLLVPSEVLSKTKPNGSIWAFGQHLWEGGNTGEGYIRFAKPIITNIHSKDWQIIAHVILFSERSLESVVNYPIMNN